MAFKDKAKKTAYQNEYISRAYDRINLTVPKGYKDAIQAHAASTGESVNAFINGLFVKLWSGINRRGYFQHLTRGHPIRKYNSRFLLLWPLRKQM